MNKVLFVFRILLFVLLCYFNFMYISLFSISGFMYLIYLGFLVLLLFLSVLDCIKKDNINKNFTYNFLCVFIFCVMNLIFVRCYYDTGFIYNSDYHMNLLSEINNYYFEDAKYINMLYLNQNLLYFIIMLIMLIGYRMLNIKKHESKYSIISVTCFFLSIVSIVPTLLCFLGDLNNIFFYLIFNVILVFILIYRLIHDNHKKREWIIFVSFLFNMFAFISIFVCLFR